MLDFSKSKFTTDYSFDSARAAIRPMSDAFSKQFCSPKSESILYGAVKSNGRCIYCGTAMYKLTPDKTPVFSNTIHYDHVYPASKLNLFEVGNVAIACSNCNLSKSDRLPMDYYDVRAAEELPLYIYDREEFEQFLYVFTEPYREKWPEHYAAGSRNIEEDAEFTKLALELLFSKVDISSSSSKYNHEYSVNKLIWDKTIKKSFETYSPLTAKDVEGRIGYSNAIFEDTFGPSAKIQDIPMSELKDYFYTLLLSKYESKNEIQKYRMLIKMLIEVLNEELMDDEFSKLYKGVPTYKKLGEHK